MKNYDLLIIGSGIVGSALSFYSSLQNKKVLVLEKNFAGYNSSGNAQGGLAPYLGNDLDIKKLHEYSYDLHTEFKDNYKKYTRINPQYNKKFLVHILKDENEKKDLILNGFGVGEKHWGGLAQKASLNSDWLIPLPAALSPKQAMQIGTAGYTAMLSVIALEKQGITPSDGEILTMRIVDRVLRPLFPKDYHNEVQVMIQLMSHDENVMPDSLAGLAASAAIQLSDFPFECAISEVRVARMNGEFIINPSRAQLEASDIDMVTKMAKNMVTKYGMSKELGTIAYGENEEEVFLGRSVTKQQNMSEDTAKKVDEEVKKIVDKGYERARKILTEKIEDLHKVAKALLVYETLTGNEIEDLINKNIYPPSKEDLNVEEDNSGSALGSIGLKPKIVH